MECVEQPAPGGVFLVLIFTSISLDCPFIGQLFICYVEEAGWLQIFLHVLRKGLIRLLGPCGRLRRQFGRQVSLLSAVLSIICIVLLYGAILCAPTLRTVRVGRKVQTAEEGVLEGVQLQVLALSRHTTSAAVDNW